MVPVNDTHTFVDGKWKILQDLKSPWKGRLTMEKYTQGQWLVQGFDRKYDDICSSLKNPAEPVYDVFKSVPGCPSEAGVSQGFLFEQIKLNFYFRPIGCLTWCLLRSRKHC